MLIDKDLLFKIVTRAHRGLYDVTKGRLGGSVANMPVLKLTTIGRRSGEKRITVLTSPIHDGDKVVIIASFGGDDRHPAWYLNLQANPEADIEMTGKTRAMIARVAQGEERSALWKQTVAAYKGYASYQLKTSREIPIVILEPRP